jgi:hypothetical protein
MDIDKRSEDAYDRGDRLSCGLLVFFVCVLLGVLFGCAPGFIILLEARSGPPVPHGGMYAVLGAWVIFIPMGLILGIVVGFIVGILVTRKRQSSN